MLSGRLGPFAQPGPQRLDEGIGFRRMLPKDLPLLVGRPSVLVENLRWHREFADVVDQPGPVEEFKFVVVEAHLLSDHHRIGPDPLGVAPRQPVMRVQRACECDQGFGGFLRRRPAELARLHLALQLPDRAAPKGRPEARWGSVREDQRQLEHGDDRHQSPEESIEHQQDDGGEDGEDNPPADRFEPAIGSRNNSACDRDEDDRDGDGREGDENAQDPCDNRTSFPFSLVMSHSLLESAENRLRLTTNVEDLRLTKSAHLSRANVLVHRLRSVRS